MELKSRLSRLLRVLVCGLLVLAVLVPAWAEAEITHGVVTAETVMFRPRIGTTDYIDRLTRGWSAEVLDTQEVSGVTWYKIKTNTPRFPNRTYEGFVHGNFFRLMTAQEQAAWLLNPVQPGAAAPAPTATQAPGTPGGTVPSGSTDAGRVTGYVRITKSNQPAPNARRQNSRNAGQGCCAGYYGPVASRAATTGCLCAIRPA